ncbi:MAG: cytochrome c biosis protein CcmG, thiol:disulfide interchange protein DsbE [Gaiellaceae bacterium]|nr:cytochrome c biosis protein CcmG, thiol:disulfide interchange protein DsbE [Gaiellaceae bacterium]
MNRLRLSGQIAAVAVVISLLGLLAWKLAQGESVVTSQLKRGGTPTAPVFSLDRLDGAGELALSSLRGKTVVLNFWASYCGPCKEETPLLQEAWTSWRDKGVVFVGVDLQDVRSDARAFMRRYDVTYPNVHDGTGWTIGRYGVTGYPETYFIDARGRVRYRIVGAVRTRHELDDAIERARRPA